MLTILIAVLNLDPMQRPGDKPRLRANCVACFELLYCEATYLAAISRPLLSIASLTSKLPSFPPSFAYPPLSPLFSLLTVHSVKLAYTLKTAWVHLSGRGKAGGSWVSI